MYLFYDYELFNATINSRTMKIGGIFCVDLMFLVHMYLYSRYMSRISVFYSTFYHKNGPIPSTILVSEIGQRTLETWHFHIDGCYMNTRAELTLYSVCSTTPCYYTFR